MDWPSIEDYRNAMQNPAQAFRDPRLQGCTPEVNRMGLPRGRAGGYAIVYRMNSGSWSTAVRVFLHRPKADREKRYRMVHEYLQQTRPRCTVDFGYDPEGLTVGTQRFPILTMEWVEGVQLGEWVRGSMSRGDTRAVKALSDAWIELVGELRGHKIAHGDLQHGNVMVVADRLALVDYDCMYVPTMRDDADREAWEFGMPGYQHPDRAGKLLGSEFDNFSAWAILIALRAVADDPGLWQRYVAETDIDNLLFTREDIEAPDRSGLWPDLIRNAKDRKVREWAAMLRASLDGPFETVPPMEIDVFDPMRTVIAGGDWRQIQELATSKKYASRAFPPDVAAKVQEATRRVECLSLLEAKIRSGRPREIAAAYKPALLDDWADPALLAQARAAAGAIELLNEFAALAQSDPTGRRVVDLWARRGGEIQGLGDLDELYQTVSDFQARLEAADRLDEAVRSGSEQAIAEAWLALADAGGHPDAEAHRDRAEGAVRRLDALRKLTALSDLEDEASDQALMKVWANVSAELDGCADADAYRDRAAAAHDRQAKLETLVRTIGEADRGAAGERDVVNAADRLPPGYGADLAERVRDARQRIDAAETLSQALRASPQSDVAIAAAAEHARKTGGWPRDPAVAARCVLAVRRRDALDALDAIPATLPMDERDARWVALWGGPLLDDCPDARAHRARYETAVARVAASAELERALAAKDAAAAKRLRDDPVLAGHPVLQRRGAEVHELIETSERIERLVDAARRGDARAFLSGLDPALLAAHAAVFLPHRSRIEDWVDGRLHEADVLGKADPQFLGDSATGTLVARWTWGQQRLARTCLVAADPARFFERPEEAGHHTQTIEPGAHRRTQGGAAVLVPPGGRRLYVTVWPVVDLGWTRRSGPAFRIGPYPEAPPKTPSKARTPAAEPASLRRHLTEWLMRLMNNV